MGFKMIKRNKLRCEVDEEVKQMEKHPGNFSFERASDCIGRMEQCL
jgi:hypothetical protein